MPAFVYILKDSNDAIYVGSTDNLARRLRQHALGHTQTTRNLDNPLLVLSQEYDSLIQARKIERRIKALKRRDYIDRMVHEGRIRMR